MVSRLHDTSQSYIVSEGTKASAASVMLVDLKHSSLYDGDDADDADDADDESGRV